MDESVEEASAENSLNDAFRFPGDDENVSGSDIISFIETVRAAPDEKFKELRNNFDETESIPIGSFKKMIQDFAEERRNSFSEESAEIEDNDGFRNTTNSLEGCGGDISTVEPDFSDLLLLNKNLSHLNLNLRTENTELRKQLDNYDEECEAQRKRIATLDKTLKHFQGSKPDVQFLFKEKDEMLSRIHSQESQVSSLQHREKVLKEESDDYRLRLSCLQDQYDSVTIVLDQLRKENIDLEQENNAIKSSCENFQLALDNREEQLILKTKECRELQERIEEYENAIEDLQEEKEALSIQVREVQLEYSICQKAVTGSAPGTPMRISIQHELNQADDGICANDYPSPICGTNYIKGNKQPNSPLTETLRKSILTSISQGTTSPRQQENRILGKLESLNPPCDLQLVENETQTTTTQMVDLYAQTDAKTANDISAQTENLNLTEMSSQTVTLNFFNISTQTEIVNFAKDSNVTEEEDKLFDEQSSKIEDVIKNLQIRNAEIQHKNEELKISLDREKSRSQYLTTQIGANRAKIQGMHEILSKEQEKIAELTAINIKLCSSKMDMWWEDNVSCKVETDFDAKANTILAKEMDSEQSSLLIAALCLAENRHKRLKANTNSLHGQDISQISFESDSESCKGISLASEVDRDTYNGRWSVLKLCKNMMECGISKKIDTILEMMREVVFSDDCGFSDNIWDKRKFDRSFTGHVKSVQSLSTKLGNVERCIGAREEEWKMASVAEMLSSKVTRLEEKLSEAQVKLRKLFDLSLECQCFSAINMLSVLKDIEHSDEVHTENVRLHNERVREVVDLSGPVIQNQIEQFEKCFNQVDKSFVAFFGRHLPSKIWLMLVCFVFFMYSTMRWEDYHVPPVV